MNHRFAHKLLLSINTTVAFLLISELANIWNFSRTKFDAEAATENPLYMY